MNYVNSLMNLNIKPMETNKRPSQTRYILAYLQSDKSITAIEALNIFGCARCASRINEIRYDLHIPIKRDWKVIIKKDGTKTRVAEYLLA